MEFYCKSFNFAISNALAKIKTSTHFWIYIFCTFLVGYDIQISQIYLLSKISNKIPLYSICSVWCILCVVLECLGVILEYIKF